MSFYVWTELVCYACFENDFGSHTLAGIKRSAIAKQARNAGWIQIGKRWYCSSCKIGKKDDQTMVA